MKQKEGLRWRWIVAGLAFALLWSSASTATKIGLQAAQPFVIAVTRFFIAGALMLFISHIFLRNRLPQQQEWKQLMLYGFLNISLYLGLYVIAMLHVSAGLGSLAVGSNPVFISIITAIWLKKPIHKVTLVSLLLCTIGIGVAAYPLVQNLYASPFGLLVLLISMLSYSTGAVYFSKNKWSGLHILTINGWQTLIGGVFLLPLLFIFYDAHKNIFTLKLTGSVLWLAIPVSIGAVQLWLYLLRSHPVKASFWLFLCPLFGFIIAAIALHEPISIYTFFGIFFVVGGLYIMQRKNTMQNRPSK